MTMNHEKRLALLRITWEKIAILNWMGGRVAECGSLENF